MATFSQNLSTILNGVYGQDVRRAIAECLDGGFAEKFQELVTAYQEKEASIEYTPGEGAVSVTLISGDDYMLGISEKP